MNELRTMHLFAGIGGGLLADLILGHRPIVAVEWEPYACQVLRERAAEGWFPGLHVWEGDVRLFDPSEYTGSVDCIHAGFPCQDISVAGKQAGVSEGTRSGLYREVLRIAGVVRPKQLFLENVSAILGNGLGTVLGDLATLGYDCRWLCIRASDVGAPHHRDRWFLLANAGIVGRDIGRDYRSERHVQGNQERDTSQIQRTGDERQLGIGQVCKVLSNTDNSGRRNGAFQYISGQQQCTANAGDDGKEVAMADTECQRQQGQGQHEQPRNPTPCRDWEATQSVNGGASDFWQVEPGLGRVANGIPNRVHRLKGLGNAQVPLQAATAYRLLGGQ